MPTAWKFQAFYLLFLEGLRGSEFLGVLKNTYQWDNFQDLVQVSKTWKLLSQIKGIVDIFKVIFFLRWKLICQWKIVAGFMLCNVTLYLASIIGISSSVYILFFL